mmetsp:Transcript_9944/g.11033  ORF Transcript_9944/g.11033 Transcript_9944/m.11033 type:complete len:167 (+) Transcript_9944:77-577(+)
MLGSIRTFLFPTNVILSILNASAFTTFPSIKTRSFTTPTSLHNNDEMRKIAEGVEYDTVSREWRAKWSTEGDKASLIACQIALESVFDEIQEVKGVKSVERVVCADCLDFKVITSVSADAFESWKADDFDPEEFFIEMLEAIDGVSDIETQTYTKMHVESVEFIDD